MQSRQLKYESEHKECPQALADYCSRGGRNQQKNAELFEANHADILERDR
jgi:hypothetical protein